MQSNPAPETNLMQKLDYNVVIITQYHTLMGTVDLKDRRFSDVLNEEHLSAIAMRDVRIARLAAPSKVIDQHTTAMLSKDQIILAFETQPKALTAKRLYGYVKKSAHRVFIILDEVEVRGYIHTTGGLELPDVHRFITTQREHFLPVTQAVVTFTSDERFVIRQDSVIVNMQYLHYIAKLPAEPKPAPVRPDVAEED
ncbi:MAG: hypothetical protein WCF84_12740 [Anaerolineae bacterium]